MHPKDQMTPNERLTAYFEGKDIDRIPAMPFTSTLAHRFMGITHREMRSTAHNQAWAQIESYKQLGIDGMTVEYGLHGIGTACGSEQDDPRDYVPSISKYVITDINDIGKLDLNMVRRENDPWLQLNYEACEICMDEVGDEVGTSVSVPGPFTAAASIINAPQLLRETRKNPEKVHELLRFCTDAAKIVMKEFISTGAECFICDPVASCNLISAQTYRDFVLSYTKELMEYAHSLNSGAGYHICGNTNKIVEDMVETGCDMLSLDSQVKLSDAKKTAGTKVPLIGNVDPNLVMLLGTVEDVHANVRQNIIDGCDSPNGFIISTGCDIPIKTNMENITAFMDAVRLYGKYPIRVEEM